MRHRLHAISTKDIVYISVFAALIAALGVLPPIWLGFVPAPITMQPLGVMLCGGILGARNGSLACALFLLMVALGFPVLSGGRGGLQIFTSPTAGFLIPWPLSAWVIGHFLDRNEARLTKAKAFCLITCGMLPTYVIGTTGLVLVFNVPLKAAVLGSSVFFVGELFKAAVASVVSIRARQLAIMQSTK